MLLRSIPFLALLLLAGCNQGGSSFEAPSGESADDPTSVGNACVSSVCPIGAKYCTSSDDGIVTCQAKVDTGYGSCGEAVTPDGVGGACTADCETCAPAAELGTEFCTRTCASDGECGANAFCSEVETVGAVCVPLHCACLAKTPGNDLVGQALSAASVGLCDIGQRFGSLEEVYPDATAHDPLRPTTFQRLYHAPAAIPGFQGRLAHEFEAVAADGSALSGALRVAARLWDEELPAPEPTSPGNSFEEEVATLFGAEAGSMQAMIDTEAANMPLEVKVALASLVRAASRAKALRDAAIPAGPDRQRLMRAPMAMFWTMREVVSRADKIDLSKERDRKLLLEEFDYGAMAQAAVDLAVAIESADLETIDASGTYQFNMLTPIGRIVIGDTSNSVYREEDPDLSGELLLVVDFGGDDRYEIPVGGTNHPDGGVAVAIDVAGSDIYTYGVRTEDVGNANDRPHSDAAGRRPTVPRHSLSEIKRHGAGALGIGMLVDLGAASDLYESLRFSQGFGALGVGALYDAGGNDVYKGEASVQGAGQWGIGVLVDGGGDDSYAAYSLSQGAVHVKAVGLLLDYSGRDDYWTGPGNAYVGSNKVAGHDYFYEYGVNQGASWGRRSDFPQDSLANGHDSSGGVGALYDLGSESDSYTCGVFCQGMGYWFGTGLLYDAGGDDSYYGRAFAGAAGIHFGVGGLRDLRGDDSYHVGASCVHTTLGMGDDLSVGWLQDDDGHDKYEGCRLSFGAAAERSTGVFVDLSGDDVYDGNRLNAFGWAEDPVDWQKPTHSRHAMETAGVFADGGGTDSYKRSVYFDPEPVGNNRSWLHPWMEVPLPQGGMDLSGPVDYGDADVCAVGLDR